MQGRGSLTRSAVGFSSESCRGPTGFGGEERTIPPSGGVLRAQVHSNHSLHLGNVHISPSCPAIEGDEDERWRQAASGRIMGFVSPSCTSEKKGTGA